LSIPSDARLEQIAQAHLARPGVQSDGVAGLHLAGRDHRQAEAPLKPDCCI
jgi:hypothetical protein